MKKHFLLLILSLIFLKASAQNCFWAKGNGTNNDGSGNAIVTDLQGNVYTTGSFKSSSLVIGSTTLNNSNPGGDAFFIAKYDPTGNAIWAKGASTGAIGYGLEIDNEGNIYVTGEFFSTIITFDTTTINGNAISYGDFFLTKYTPNGDVLWAKSAGGNSYDYGKSVSTDFNNNVYVAGYFYSDQIIFGNDTLVNTDTTDITKETNLFITKFDKNGNSLWSRSAGGNKYEYAYAISVHQNNVYVSGTFQSDSINFNGTILYNAYPGSHVSFVTKYDINGNVLWANNFGSGNVGNAIANDDIGNIYITGTFGAIFPYGANTLNGSQDVFILKLDSAGNSIWATKAGGTNEDVAYDIDIDSNHIYITGYYKSNIIIFGTDTLTNYGNQNPDIFIAKFDTAGNTIWGAKAGGTGTDLSYSIAIGKNNNTYFAGKLSSNPSYFGNATLNPAGWNMFVADVFNFVTQPPITKNTSCYGFADGTATAIASEGNIPYSYTWYSTPIQSTVTATGLSIGTYSVEITEAYGCAHMYTFSITQPAEVITDICMVTVDSLSQHNIIIWDKTPYTSVDSFIVYREIATNDYQPIARIAYDSLSQFIDTVETKYFPNTGNPNAGTYRYKIQAHDTCGGYTSHSPYHNTIYFLNNNGTFYWTQPYTIENNSNPVSNYILMRDDSSNGNWHAVTSVAGTQQVVSDPLYQIYKNTASWRVMTQWNISCVPTMKTNGIYNTSFSNIYSLLGVGFNKSKIEGSINTFPNPASYFYHIQSNEFKIGALTIFDNLGTEVFKINQVNKNNLEIDVSNFANGIYYIQITTETGNVYKKMVKN